MFKFHEEEVYIEREDDMDKTEQNTFSAMVYAQLSQNNQICEGLRAPVARYNF